jgi:transcriptional/translational regulatory protein YebC/TACO1
MFQQKGIVTIAESAVDEDKVAEIALEAGAEDYSKSEDVWEITCEPDAYEPLRQGLDAAGIERQSSSLSMIPSNTVSVDEENARKVLALVEALEDHDDVQNVYSNFEISDEVMASIGSS